MIQTSASEAETMEIARKAAAKLQPGLPVLLRGNLGAGKTVFARSMIRALSADPNLEVPSPTFTLVQTYDTQKGVIWHFDLYRLEDPEEIHELGWEEAMAEGLVIVEWPERLGTFAPAQYLDISLKAVENDPAKRIIEITRVE